MTYKGAKEDREETKKFRGGREVYYKSQLPNRFHAKELIKFTLRFLSCW